MRKFLLPILLIGLLIFAACGTALPQEEPSPAPQFAVQDLQGNQVVFEPGQPLVINFWASWCPSCRRMMPAWQTVYNEFAASGDVRIMSINVGETRDRAMQFINNAGHTFPVYFDLDQQAAQAFAITHFPTTVFISAQGEVLHRHIGTLNETMLRLHIDNLRTD
ncbi:MAG: TlpA family protein disulfide reductase [Oscillospiraceae bacterium]|nr:TlpA family protein disulfide reductase [Oscillospiraceae bacterium]